ncbi:Predicted arabinose efflux permease, MFS family [Nakamurella panacisegetis]|uniref:Predicted arabinose efflux permease, MFS family n=1 Tax=Nakamurella panacisegetis TaxID=1090615 RepID=A0A1H0J8S6_9ACTN|nr:MFS transporter [Nakamurella panacisegetis]SDO39940.1 Predicted arabinose efflux permease, MFS family [Nakamurella panacisegetis]
MTALRPAPRASISVRPEAVEITSPGLLAQYRQLPAMAGRSFLPIAFLARLPISMTQIGTVVLVSTSFSSIAAGGVAAGFLAAGSAVGGPVVGRLAERFGQRSVMLAASLLNALATLALVGLVVRHAPWASIYGLALLSGASTPQIGPMVRARWVRMTKGGPRLGYAMSYEGAADETAYVLGPAAVSLMTALASPALAMVTAAVLVGVFGSLVALHPTAPVTPTGADRASQRSGRTLTPRILGLILGTMAVGCFFGGMQTGVTGVATAAGLAGAAGGIYAIMGVGSAIAGLSSAAIPVRWALSSRLVFFAAVMVALATPLLFVSGVTATIAVMVPLGCAVGPYIITLFSLAEREVSASRTAGVMTLLSSGLVVGYAAGSSIGGSLAGASPAGAFAVSVIAMLIGTGIALALRDSGRPRRAEVTISAQ